MYEYRTASFMVPGAKNGQPIKEVDAALAQLVQDRWEFVQITSSASAVALHILLVVRRLID